MRGHLSKQEESQGLSSPLSEHLLCTIPDLAGRLSTQEETQGANVKGGLIQRLEYLQGDTVALPTPKPLSEAAQPAAPKVNVTIAPGTCNFAYEELKGGPGLPRQY